MQGWRTTLSHHPSRDVCACHRDGAEGSRKADLLRLLAWSSEAEPWGRCSCHPACGVSNFPEGDLGPLPWGVHAQKAAQPAILQAWMDGKGHQRHPVPPWGVTYEGEEVPLSWRKTKGGLPWPPCSPAIKLDPALRHKGGTTHVMRPSGRLRRHTGGCWEAACMLELNIERLNKEADGAKCWCPCTHSHPKGRSLERHSPVPELA